MPSLKRFFTVFLFSFFSIHFSSYACKVVTPRDFAFASSLKEHDYFAYNSNSIIQELPYSSVINCSQTAIRNKFLMIGFGPEVLEVSDSLRGSSFNGDFRNSGCRINHSTLKSPITFENKKSIFQKRLKYLNQCVQIQVSDFSKKPISYPANQKGCQVTQVAPHQVLFSGGYCFFKPNLDSEYNVQVRIKEQCLKREEFESNKLDLLDFYNSLNFYIAGDASGKSEDLTAIGASTVRLSVNPINEIVKESDDFGVMRPTFPSQWIVSDINLGKIQIGTRDNHGFIRSSLLVDNNCKESCLRGVCSSPCHYFTPFVGEFVISEWSKKKGKYEEMARWFDGGVAPGKWQGLIEGEGFELQTSQFTAGNKYKLDVSFEDPKMSFGYMKGQIKNRIGLIHRRYTPIRREGAIDEIPVVRELGELDNIPVLPVIGGIDFTRPLNGLLETRRRFINLFNSHFWPPMYESACDVNLKNCTNNFSNLVNLSATFTLESIPDDVNNFAITNLEIERKSKFLNSYKIKILNQPEVDCTTSR